jgi:hypothetical protein
VAQVEDWILGVPGLIHEPVWDYEEIKGETRPRRSRADWIEVADEIARNGPGYTGPLD